MKKYFLFVATIIVISCNSNKTDDNTETTTTNMIPAPQNISFSVVASYPHNTESYTQGLVFHNNALYEGTGIEGESKLLKTELTTGKIEQTVQLEDKEFGEGITILNGKIYQLTWLNKKVYMYDETSFKKLREFRWDQQGWGITHNGTDLIISTGSNNLYFVEPATFQIKNIVGVFDNNGPVGNLNELEFINGSVYANVYTSEYIVRIDPATGHVTGRMNLEGILQQAGRTADFANGQVLNGIAYDSSKNSMYVTGKNWPLLFEVKMN